MSKSSRRSVKSASSRNRITDDTRIRFTVKENPRNKGTRAFKVVSKVLPIARKATGAKMGDLKKRGYMPVDAQSDIDHGYAKRVG